VTARSNQSSDSAARDEAMSPEGRMRVERGRMVRERWLHLLLLGFALSVVAHVLIMLRLWWTDTPGYQGSGTPSVEISLQELPQPVDIPVEQVELPDPSPKPVGPVTPELDPLPNLSTAEAANNPAENSVGTIEAPGVGAIVGPGGPGSGIGIGSGKGGGGTSFFGVGGRGTRFAFVVDISGSMEEGDRLQTAFAELKRSIGVLPDFAQFFVVLYANGAHEPDFERDGWLRATRTNISRMKAWIDQQEARGGTYPLDALRRVFQLPQPPDVVFFLTDGLIPGDTPEEIQKLAKDLGREVVVNTIGFGGDAGAEPLMRIAKQNRGVFRAVATGRPKAVTP
jgi:hypothetical protein